jgi:hypothetical protein
MKKDYFFIVTILVLGAVVLLNVFAGMLTERFYLKADLTVGGLYTADAQVAALLAGMEEAVDIIVMADEAAWTARGVQIVEILKQYSVLSGGRVRVQYVDPVLNTFDGPKYDNNLTTLRDTYSELRDMGQDDIIFLSSRRAALRAAHSLYAVVHDGQGNQSRVVDADKVLANAILFVLNEQVAKAVFLEGHGESDAEELRFIFEGSGYDCVSLNLAANDLPEDTNIVITAGPKHDFTANEIEKLEKYLRGGGNAMVFYEYEAYGLTNLDSFLYEWGVGVELSLTVDPENGFYRDNSSSSPLLIPVGIYPSANSIEHLELNPVLITRARPVLPRWEGDSWQNLTFSPMLYTALTAHSISLIDGDTTRAGPIPMAYHIRRAVPERHPMHSNLIVANMGMAEDFILKEYSGMFFNGQLLDALAGEYNPFREDQLYIAPKPLDPARMPVTRTQGLIVLYGMVLALPLLIMGLGILVHFRRRHR